MNIQLNGKRTMLPAGITIGDLIREKGLDPATVVVEHNRAIVASADWGRTRIEENDALEVLRFVGGG